MGVADHARRVARVGEFFLILYYIIYITSGLSYHLEQKFSKNTLPCSVQPHSDRRHTTDRQTDGQTDGRTHEHSEIINIDYLPPPPKVT